MIQVLILNLLLLVASIIPLAYINEQTMKQIAQFNEIRHFLHRMVSDQKILMMPANGLASKIKPTPIETKRTMTNQIAMPKCLSKSKTPN